AEDVRIQQLPSIIILRIGLRLVVEALQRFFQPPARPNQLQVIDVLRRRINDETDKAVENRSRDEYLRGDRTAASYQRLQDLKESYSPEHILPQLPFEFAFPSVGSIQKILLIERDHFNLDRIAQSLIKPGIHFRMLHLILLQPLDEVIIDKLGKSFLRDQAA